jgi:hypothetical protein
MKTKKQRRIAILKDAIAQINANKIKALPGEVVELPNEILISTETNAKPVLQAFFKKQQVKEPCYACARGSLLLCTIHKENDFELCDLDGLGGGFNSGSITDSRLLKVFTEQQLQLMENAFEVEFYLQDLEEDDLERVRSTDKVDYSSYCQNAIYLNEKLQEKSVLFGAKYENPNDRLLAIFKNAIKNKGTFKP